MPIDDKKIVALIIKSNVFSSRNFGTLNTATSKTAYEIKFVIKLINKSSCTVLVNCSRSSRTWAQTRIPYVGIPSCANIEKYEITDVAN